MSFREKTFTFSEDTLKKSKLSGNSNPKYFHNSVDEPKRKSTITNFIKKKFSHKKNHSLTFNNELIGEVSHYDVSSSTLMKTKQSETLNKGTVMSLIDSTLNETLKRHESLSSSSILAQRKPQVKVPTKDLGEIIKITNKQQLYYESIFAHLTKLSNLSISHNNNSTSQLSGIKDSIALKFFNQTSISLEALNNLRLYLIVHSFLDLDTFVIYMHQAVLAYHGYDYEELKFKLLRHETKRLDLVKSQSSKSDDPEFMHINDRNQSIFDKSILDQSIFDQSFLDQSILDQSILDQSIVDQSILDEPITDESNKNHEHLLFSSGKLTHFNESSPSSSQKFYELHQQLDNLKKVLSKLNEERLKMESIAFKHGFVYNESELDKIEMYYMV